jgi:hypothetical protein
MSTTTFTEVEPGKIYPARVIVATMGNKQFVSQELPSDEEYTAVLELAYTRPKGTA